MQNAHISAFIGHMHAIFPTHHSTCLSTHAKPPALWKVETTASESAPMPSSWKHVGAQMVSPASQSYLGIRLSPWSARYRARNPGRRGGGGTGGASGRRNVSAAPVFGDISQCYCTSQYCLVVSKRARIYLSYSYTQHNYISKTCWYISNTRVFKSMLKTITILLSIFFEHPSLATATPQDWWSTASPWRHI